MRELKRRQTWVWYESEPPIFKNLLGRVSFGGFTPNDVNPSP